MTYRGTWDALTNNPTLSNNGGGPVGTKKGDYYVVNVAGTTSIDGVSDWEVGDWIVNNGSIWEKIDNTDKVSSVNGQVGVVQIGLPSVLGQNNTTGANDISVNTGQSVIFNNGGFTGSIQEGTYTGNQTYTLPDQSGTFALLSDIPTTPTLSAVLTAGNTTGANNISVNTGQNIIFNNGGFTGSIQEGTFTGNQTYTLPDQSGTFALLSDIPANAGDNIYNTDGTLTGNRIVTTSTNTIRFSNGSDDIVLDPTNNRIGFKNAGIGDKTGWITTNGTLTADRTYTLQNASGTLAFLSDIPATPTLSAVLTAGNTTGANDILVERDIVFVTNALAQQLRSDNATANDRVNITFNEGARDSISMGMGNGIGGIFALGGTSSYLGYASGGITNIESQIEFTASGIFVKQSPTTPTAKVFNFEKDYTIELEDNSGLNAGNLSIPMPILTANRTQTFQDADGTIALLSDIPSLTGYVTGSGTTNKSVRWTSASSIGDGAFNDNGTNIGLNSVAVASNMMGISANSSATYGLFVDHIASITLNYGIGVTSGGGVISKGIVVNTTPSSSESVGGEFVSTQNSAGDNYGIKIVTNNIGAGNHYGIQIQDGTQGAGKVLTSDASGRGTWQTPGGSATWSPPTKDLSAYLGNGANTLANANAGFQKSFSATANDEVLAEITLFNNNVNYDGSDLQIRLRSQLFNTAPGGGDDVIWEVDYVFLQDGDDGDSKTATLISDTIDVSTRTANQLYTDVISTNLTGLSGAHTLGLTIRRRSSGGGADSYPSAVDVFGIELLKV
jgi:hypothetical protein